MTAQEFRKTKEGKIAHPSSYSFTNAYAKQEKLQLRKYLDACLEQNEQLKELLELSGCPDINCNNEGVTGDLNDDLQFIPEFCKWCDKRNKLLNQEKINFPDNPESADYYFHKDKAFQWDGQDWIEIVPEKNLEKENEQLKEDKERLDNEITEMGKVIANIIIKNEQLKEALRGMLNIVNDSIGVAGYHLNNEVAVWNEFTEVDTAEKLLTKNK